MRKHTDQSPGFNASVLAIEIARASPFPAQHSCHGIAVLAHRACQAGRQLRRAHERQCNGYKDHRGDWDQRAADRDERRIDRLRALLLAQLPADLRACVKFNGDPRGPAARLVTQQHAYGLSVE